jgi:hypothetical protein
MRKFSRTRRAIVITLLTIAVPSLMAAPLIVSINDVPNAAPVVQVKNAPVGYDVIKPPDLPPGYVDPEIEEGAAVVFWGLDLSDVLDDWGGRLTVPNAPDPARSSVDVVWIEVYNEMLVVAFDSALPGHYYGNPDPDTNGDEDLGDVTDNWVTVYSSEQLVIRFKPHTYRTRD